MSGAPLRRAEEVDQKKRSGPKKSRRGRRTRSTFCWWTASRPRLPAPVCRRCRRSFTRAKRSATPSRRRSSQTSTARSLLSRPGIPARSPIGTNRNDTRQCTKRAWRRGSIRRQRGAGTWATWASPRCFCRTDTGAESGGPAFSAAAGLCGAWRSPGESVAHHAGRVSARHWLVFIGRFGDGRVGAPGPDCAWVTAPKKASRRRRLTPPRR